MYMTTSRGQIIFLHVSVIFLTEKGILFCKIIKFFPLRKIFGKYNNASS